MVRSGPKSSLGSSDLSRSTIRLVAPVLTSLLVMLAAAVISVEVLSTIRAYVGGEGLYSKGQKNATYYLAQYAISESEEDFRQYQTAIAFPLGDLQARLALQRRPVDLKSAREGFLKGGNDAADIGTIIVLFRLLGRFGPVRHAFDIWAEGDSYTLRLRALAARLHPDDPGTVTAQERIAIRAELSAINRDLTPLAARFSSTLAQLARTTRTMLIIALAFGTLLTGFLCIRVTRARVMILANQHRILQLIASGAELDMVFATLARFVEATDGLCALVALDAGAAHYSLIVAPTLPPGLNLALQEGSQAMDSGPYAQAVTTRMPVVVANLATYPLSDAMRRYVREANLQSLSVWPIIAKEQVLGVLSVFSRVPRPPALDAHLIGSCTDLAGIAIETHRAADRIRHLAHHDDLTGLPNRFLFNDQLPRALARARRTGRSIGVLFFDLDRFKIINDTLGHAAGDAVLCQIAKHLLQCVRASDVLARIGGDEFAVLAELFSGPQELVVIAQRLLGAMASPVLINDKEYQLSGSIGISTYPKDGTDGASLLKHADIAMYRAKTAGGNTHEFYSSEMSINSVERLALESELRQAVLRREFEVHYQPKIDIGSGRICGAEALVRWQHPQRGLLLPGEFILVAEEVGLIGSIGNLVLDTVCRDITRWRADQLPPVRVAVNLSAQQFGDSRLLDDLDRTLQETQCDPRWLEFEITESVVMTRPDRALGLLEHIKSYGITLAIDDFGTGHSSLAYLKRLPVDSVKIDYEFIRDIATDPDDLAITKIIIVLGHSLGLKVIAEGVESPTQLKLLKRHRCDEYQGFLFSRAVPAADFGRMLREHGEAPSPASEQAGNVAVRW
jgi:diguanylate cyclase (GGDEF)-like protein